MTEWKGEVCKRCLRRNCVGFSVSNEIWSQVVGDRYTLLCTSCFDELAEEGQITYQFGEVWPVSWSDWQEEAA